MSYIFLIESDDTVREALRQFFVFEGFAVETAPPKKNALEYLLNVGSAPGLILLDLCMPELNGAAFMFALRGHERLQNVPVIATIGPQYENIRPIAAEAVLTKPLELNVLLGLCLQWCGSPTTGFLKSQ